MSFNYNKLKRKFCVVEGEIEIVKVLILPKTLIGIKISMCGTLNCLLLDLDCCFQMVNQFLHHVIIFQHQRHSQALQLAPFKN